MRAYSISRRKRSNKAEAAVEKIADCPQASLDPLEAANKLLLEHSRTGHDANKTRQITALEIRWWARELSNNPSILLRHCG